MIAARRRISPIPTVPFAYARPHTLVGTPARLRADGESRAIAFPDGPHTADVGQMPNALDSRNLELHKQESDLALGRLDHTGRSEFLRGNETTALWLLLIATRHGGIPAVVVDCETGLLVEEADVECMAQRMKRLVDDPALAARLGTAGRARALPHFSMVRSIAALWEVLEHTKSRQRPGNGAA